MRWEKIMKKVTWIVGIVLFFIFSSIGVGIELITEENRFVPFIVGVCIVYFSTKKFRRHTLSRTCGVLLGTLMICIPLFSTMSIWIVIGLSVLLVVMLFSKIFTAFSHFPSIASKKEYISPEIIDATVVKRQKQQWISKDSSSSTYEWDDINMNVALGDTIIDLGNTILPREENVIIIRKGMGEVRIIVPVGVGIAIHHSGLYGQLQFEGENISIRNEQIVLHSYNYQDASKRIRIYTNVLVGEVKVIEL